MLDISLARFLGLGAAIGGVSYGVTIILAGMCIHLLIKSSTLENVQIARKANMILLAYTGVMTILSTIIITSTLQNLWWLLGDASRSNELVNTAGIGVIGSSLSFVGNWMSDGLLVWRCIILYRDSRLSPFLVITIFSSMLLLSIGLGIVDLIKHAHGVTIAFLLMTLSINIITTALIVGRLLMHRRRVGTAVGGNITSHYTSLITIFIESAALIMMVGIIFTTTSIFNVKAQYLFSQSVIHIQAIASFLMILRVCQGKAWSNRMMEKPRGSDAVPLGTGLNMRSTGDRQMDMIA